MTTQYLYDGLNVVRELSTAGNADLLSGLGVDDWFGRTQSSATVAMVRNALGSTIGLVNAGGAIATSYGYEPFGATAASGAASSDSHRFTGREQDPTGLYYLRNRYYNPMLGRFLSPDPIGIAGGINLYAYTFDDPMNWVDPLGLSPGASGGSGPGPGGTWQPCRGGRCVSFAGAEDQGWSNQGIVPGAIADMETADPCKPRDFGGPCSPKVPSPTPVVLPAPSQALEGLALFMIGFELLVEGPPTSIALGALLGTPFGPIGIVTGAILGMGAAVEEALIASELMAQGAQMMGLSGPMAPGPLQPKQ